MALNFADGTRALELLRQSHRRMTPEAIADHTLRLVTVMEIQERVISDLVDLIDSFDAALEARSRGEAHERPAFDSSQWRYTLKEIWPELYQPTKEANGHGH
ncbi:hypothetical protein [Mesorhizobium amorphae]|uniref:hypothetical protein n=1 Tax=Mesorhizobium amorphae TaxID=71433 RepID=UPI001784F81A|nr:hypothetical protein [Mesorhizobium amorphae]